MKKVSLLIALCAALMIAAPAMALEVEVSGHYFIEHYNHSNETLNKDDATDDYSTMEFMAKPVFKINENITLTTQFTALQGHIWGDDADSNLTFDTAGDPDGVDSTNNFDWKAAYLTIKTPIGGFIAGRYIDTPWGTTFFDSTASHGSNSLHKDRVMYVLPIGNTISGFVYQKMGEYDIGNETTDDDNLKAYVFSSYKKEKWSTGLLIANYRYRTFATPESVAVGSRALWASDPANVAAVGALAASNPALYGPPIATEQTFLGLNGAAAGASIGTAEADAWVFLPYFKGEFGKFGVEAELVYANGELDQGTYSDEKLDVDALAYMCDVSYNFGPISLMVGTTFIPGDTDFRDDETSALGFIEQNIDHERGFLLTSDTAGFQNTLGGSVDTPLNFNSVVGMDMGNLSDQTGVTALAGAQMYYFDIGWQATENLEVGLFVVKSMADDPPEIITGEEWDDDHGEEYDFRISWDIMDNLNFTGIVAHLSAGDFWKQGDPDKEIDDNTTFYGCLTVEF